MYDLKSIPEKGGVIIAANHISFLDPPLLWAVLKRKPTFIAKKYLFSVPIIGHIVRLYSIPVDVVRTRPSTIKEAVRRLKNGELLVIFPEGGINHDGSFINAKRGIGMIASMSGACVVPAFIDGTQRVLPVGARFFKMSNITLRFGCPLKLEKGEDEDEFGERICRDIMDRIKSLGSCL
ncbi:lysophospholipid acyltransferase family protein [Dissulfurispira thermophila]|uniref:lysophospholipid acyltransferase family protein n=1 Tax=Dissulfurispira thermophila TaxID=2715679 RepID=UPI00193DFFEC|nr:lysophospholipid acyltransferase family protein [Dissulfurispira thermophila]